MGTIADFKPFGQTIANRFALMSKGELFVVGDDSFGDKLYEHYLASFPEGTNPIYKTKTEHDCNCCRNFVRNLGRVVAISNEGTIQTVWDIGSVGYPYDAVAESMRAFVRTQPITSIFRVSNTIHSYSALETKSMIDGSVTRFNHFYGKIEKRHQSPTPDKARGDINTTVQVFRRGLTELTMDALDQVLSLIDAKALYRGAEFRNSVAEFRAQKAVFAELAQEHARALFAFKNANSPAARFRNTAIGTLVTDLSDGMDLEKAVKSFESKVAPTNYKRTTALITPRMVEDAMKTIRELDLEDALQRRLATIKDVSVKDVMWVDNSVKSLMKGGVEDLLMGVAKKSAGPVKTESAVDIGIADFVKDVLPKAKSMEVVLQNKHLTNFATLTAPVHDAVNQLFKWGNDFAWSYDGNITDSIREKVKAAGGEVDGAMRVSLAWHNHDDLDLHVIDPTGAETCFFHKHTPLAKLDVDMNAGCGRSREPVENVSFSRLVDGDYLVKVDQYSRRETANTGFTVEIADGKTVKHFTAAVSQSSGSANIAKITVKAGAITEVKALNKSLTSADASIEKWGLRTQEKAKVKTVLLSPNHWNDATGNKHYFFILEGCEVNEPVRGIYNEFLKPGLEKHRKVFEVLGDKTKCQPQKDQLSGLGFSETRGDNVSVAVTTDRATRIYNVQF